VGAAFTILVPCLWWRPWAAADEPQHAAPAPAWAAASGIEDTRLTVAARRQLFQDERFLNLALGVSVRGNIATLWGGVPTEALAGRAAELVKQVPGIAAVHNQLRVEPIKDASKGNPHGETSWSTPTEESLRQGSAPSANLMGRAGDAHPATTLGNSAHPEGVNLLAPVPGPVSFAPRSSAPVAVRSMPDLSAAVEQLRRSDGRCNSIDIQVRDGVVYLRGQANRWVDLFALARDMSRLSGVQRVILEEAASATDRGNTGWSPVRQP
jgi:hypothetical protein